ncbi:uncharacterized protein LY89DRAFT_67100 [Mollisia scopiformis]|uniref:MARVEL domain-containing protein n=1 Tax=Mollisia scopiformis TaxID=149040 RepID=A0A194XAU8_MOLSC|nr:uncharacterized protein LY89DRAFT_67100 [Mollisia scopiformis]KUJ16887.1 hypothetical protein LY89DRAFT_67100 [Mollisia scopiformis]
MSSAVTIALRGGQAFHSVVVLCLSSYVAYENNHSLNPSSTEINFLLFASSFSIITLLLLEVVPLISPRRTSPYAALVVQALVSFLYMGGFIALSVFLSRLLFCEGSVCLAARLDAVFAAFSYAVWTASATISGIQISKRLKSGMHRDLFESIEEKVVAEKV